MYIYTYMLQLNYNVYMPKILVYYACIVFPLPHSWHFLECESVHKIYLGLLPKKRGVSYFSYCFIFFF